MGESVDVRDLLAASGNQPLLARETYANVGAELPRQRCELGFGELSRIGARDQAQRGSRIGGAAA